MKKFRKEHVNWQRFLCGTPASDCIFQKESYEEKIRKPMILRICLDRWMNQELNV